MEIFLNIKKIKNLRTGHFKFAFRGGQRGLFTLLAKNRGWLFVLKKTYLNFGFGGGGKMYLNRPLHGLYFAAFLIIGGLFVLPKYLTPFFGIRNNLKNCFSYFFFVIINLVKVVKKEKKIKAFKRGGWGKGFGNNKGL